ncbi:phospholipid scramblase 2-like [Zophobas morio]|uniref:phospholipid scramblase 2-like n=1 Tax=Zophobas morio TaxID=2755281 RepID=UPI0030838CB0
MWGENLELLSLVLQTYDQRENNAGLEILTRCDELLVHRKKDFMQCRIEDQLGRKLYYVDENESLKRICCESTFPYDTYIFDNFDNQVIYLYHPPACNFCCWSFCSQTMEVSSPPGTPVATVEKVWEIFGATFTIKNPSGQIVLFIKGPRCPSGYSSRNVEFLILLSDGITQLGNVTKLWVGVEEMDDHYRITFPVLLDVKLKAALLGACFLIDSLYYEHSRAER